MFSHHTTSGTCAMFLLAISLNTGKIFIFAHYFSSTISAFDKLKWLQFTDSCLEMPCTADSSSYLIPHMPLHHRKICSPHLLFKLEISVQSAHFLILVICILKIIHRKIYFKKFYSSINLNFVNIK